MQKTKLTKEEQKILDSYEQGEWKSVPRVAQQKKEYAKAALEKNKHINKK